MKLKKRKTDEEFIQVVKDSFSIREVLEKLELCGTGGNYTSFHNRIERLGISTSHFRERYLFTAETRPQVPTKKLDEILTENSNYQSYKLGKRLVSEGKFIPECFICKITDWQDKPLSLHLDHINGVRTDNRIDNLRLLCPNCHSQTPTYAGKNKKKYSYELKKHYCPDCNATTSRKTKTGRCNKCVKKFVRKRELEKLQ